MLLQEKKKFSLKDHVEEFTNKQDFSENDLKELLASYHPKYFSKIYDDSKKFPVNHITTELELHTDNIQSILCQCKTDIGKMYFNLLLNNPSSDLNILNERQRTIKYFYDNGSLQVREKFANLQKDINECLWFFKDKNEHSDYIYSMIYFNKDYFKFLNKIEPFLTITNAYKIIISPVLSVVSPLMYIILPFILIRLMRLKIPFKFFLKMMWQQSSMISVPFIKSSFMQTVIKWFSKFLSVFLYCQNVYNSYSTSRTTLGIVNMFQSKLENIKQILGINTSLRENFGNYCDNNPKCFKNIENGSIYKGTTSIFSNKGKILKDFYEFVENKKELLGILNGIGLIDCYMSISNKLREISYYSLPKILDLKRPEVNIEGLWHPGIKKENIVRNDVLFDKSKRNYVLTGPNAAGKSTFIKSVFMNIYLAQTIGVCNSKSISITPFSYMMTGIRNQDSQGAESLFEAEVHKIRDYLDMIKQKEGFTFSILDEVFTSTNYQEGFAASKGLCKTIGGMKNSLHIVATHYTKLYKMVKEKGLGFRNIKFRVDFGEDGKILFPYKLEKGYSKQFIALKLMKQKDCDNEFLENCIKYL